MIHSKNVFPMDGKQICRWNKTQKANTRLEYIVGKE